MYRLSVSLSYLNFFRMYCILGQMEYVSAQGRENLLVWHADKSGGAEGKN